MNRSSDHINVSYMVETKNSDVTKALGYSMAINLATASFFSGELNVKIKTLIFNIYLTYIYLSHFLRNDF